MCPDTVGGGKYHCGKDACWEPQVPDLFLFHLPASEGLLTPSLPPGLGNSWLWAGLVLFFFSKSDWILIKL